MDSAPSSREASAIADGDDDSLVTLTYGATRKRVAPNQMALAALEAFLSHLEETTAFERGTREYSLRVANTLEPVAPGALLAPGTTLQMVAAVGSRVTSPRTMSPRAVTSPLTSPR